MIPAWVLLDEAADVAGCLLQEAFGVAQKRENLDPLDDHDFELILKQLFSSLVRAAAPEEQRALQSVQTKIDLNWPGMSEAEREQALRAIGTALGGVPKLVLPKVEKILTQQGPQIIAATKREAVASYELPIQASFTLVDQRVIDAARKSQSHYIRDEYGKRIDLASAKAMHLVAHGLEQGLDRYDIADRLKPALEAIGVHRSIGYYRMIASVFAARARAWGTLAAFDEAGIEYMEWVSMLDESTSDVCRFLDGKTFPVTAAKERHERVATSEDPESVVELQPWVSAGKAKDGSVALFYKQNGERKPIALVERSGVGAKDDRGEYSRAASVDKLVKAGITSPPAHAHCRSQLVPASATPSRGQVPASAPVGSSLTSNVLPYAGGKVPVETASQTPATPPPTTAFRPLPRALPIGFNPEALPEVSATETAAQQAEEAKRQAIASAIAKLNALPSPYANSVASPLPKWTDLDKDWKPPVPKKPQIAGGKKKKPVAIAVDQIHGPGFYSKSVAAKYAATFDPEAPILLVRSNGTLTPLDAHEAHKVLAAHLHGQTAIQAKVIDLDKLAAKKPKKSPLPPPEATTIPPATPSAAPPPPPPPVFPMKKIDASVILHQQVGAQRGSNEGGFYKGSDGVDRYVKLYDEEGKAECEHLANAVYRDLGLVAPESVLFEHKGKVAFASVILPNAKTLRDVGHSAERSKKILEGFVADVLVGNWDVVGVGNNGGDDNVVFLPDGRVARIDNGGSFLMKGLDGRKPQAALNAITEWEKFLDPSINFNYARVAKNAGVTRAEDMKDVVVDGIQKVLALEKASGGWAAYVDKHVPQLNGADKARIAEMLQARTRLLEHRLGDLTKQEVSAQKPRYLAKQYSTVLPRAGLKLEDLPETNVIKDHYGKIDRWRPDRLPSGESFAEFKERAAQAIKDLAPDEARAIKAFKASAYIDIRDSEEKGKPNAQSDAIQRGLSKCTPEPGTAWRGICELPKAVVDRYLQNPVFQLGRMGGATSSTSWCIDVSVDSFFGGPDEEPGGKNYRILYKLHGKTGIPVQTISMENEDEHEILFGRNAAFRITGLSRAKGQERTLIVEAEEIVGVEREAMSPVQIRPPKRTPQEAALDKLAALPKDEDEEDLVTSPIAAGGGKVFGPGNPVPTPPGKIPENKVTEANSLPVTLLDPAKLTLHSANVDAYMVEIAINDGMKPGASLLVVKQGGQMYLAHPHAEATAAAYHLLGMELPVRVIDLDAD